MEALGIEPRSRNASARWSTCLSNPFESGGYYTTINPVSFFRSIVGHRSKKPDLCLFNLYLPEHHPPEEGFRQKLAQVFPPCMPLGEAFKTGRPSQAASVNCGSAVKIWSDFYVAIRSTTTRPPSFRSSGRNLIAPFKKYNWNINHFCCTTKWHKLHYLFPIKKKRSHHLFLFSIV